MEKFAARIPGILKFLVITLIVFTIMMAFTPVNLYADNPEQTPVKTEKPEESSGDTLIVPVPLRQRLNDPNYDTRFERGALQPWHDTRSIYLRRTIPLSQLAAAKLPDTMQLIS